MPILSERLNNERISDTIIMNSTDDLNVEQEEIDDDRGSLDTDIRRSVTFPTNNSTQAVYKPISKCSFCRQNIDKIYKIYLT